MNIEYFSLLHDKLVYLGWDWHLHTTDFLDSIVFVIPRCWTDNHHALNLVKRKPHQHYSNSYTADFYLTQGIFILKKKTKKYFPSSLTPYISKNDHRPLRKICWYKVIENLALLISVLTIKHLQTKMESTVKSTVFGKSFCFKAYGQQLPFAITSGLVPEPQNFNVIIIQEGQFLCDAYRWIDVVPETPR